jgi:hypothetical protein
MVCARGTAGYDAGMTGAGITGVESATVASGVAVATVAASLTWLILSGAESTEDGTVGVAGVGVGAGAGSVEPLVGG